MIRRLLSCSLAVIAFASSQSAQADFVRVGAGGSQTHGHGYVFGSATDGACWIAAPAHVFQNIEGKLSEQVLVNKGGLSGVAIKPVHTDPSIDLAFAKVTGLGQRCLDRLSSRSLDSLLEVGTKARLRLTNDENGGAKTIPLRIRTANTGIDALYFSVEPIASAADTEPKIIQGYSGGTVDINNSSALGADDQVLGLVLNVCDGIETKTVDFDDMFDEESNRSKTVCADGHYATVIRMDRIRQMFDDFEAKTTASTAKTSDVLTPKLLNFTGKSIAGDPSGLLDGGNCWEVKPDKEGRVTLDYIMPDDMIVGSVVVSSCAGDEALRGAEIRGGGTLTTTKPYRYCAAKLGSVKCSVGSRKPKILSLRLNTKASLKLNTIAIE